MVYRISLKFKLQKIIKIKIKSISRLLTVQRCTVGVTFWGVSTQNLKIITDFGIQNTKQIFKFYISLKEHLCNKKSTL